MELQKYNGNIHPDEWINDLQAYFNIKQKINVNFAISLVDSIIKLPTGIDDIEKLRNALKENIFFTIFKNTNKRKLQSLKYNPERKGGDTSYFISTFCKLCYNAEINDVKEQTRYLYNSLPDNYFKFEELVLEETNLIRNGSIVALKHVATGKYLNSTKNLCYTTGSKTQLVFAGSPEPVPNSLWKIEFDDELAAYTDNSIVLQHVKSEIFLGMYCVNTGYRYDYCKSPLNNYTEVSCYGNDRYFTRNWKFSHSKFSKLKNHQGYLKSNDIINLNIKKSYDNRSYTIRYGQVEVLRSHDIQFTIGNDTFQEVVCHNERLGGNDEWCIELIHES
ncbi:unnamed protein product [Rhizophagus irregularis]|nr:unnamed protein product [Rhizophagus irregularis]CAB5384785.1 unnamed protein product [Rhizophagus irregularis]